MENDLRELLRRALLTSACNRSACVFPTILAAYPKDIFQRTPDRRWEDAAITYLGHFGFKSDRTSKNPNAGYPRRFWDLNDVPPWVHVGTTDTDGPVSPARENDLRPLYLQANEASYADLLVRLRENLQAQRSFMAERNIELPVEDEQLTVEHFEEQLLLARCVGADDFERLYEAVFDFDEPTPAKGAPDLFVWDSESGVWFFAEVKGPHDHLRRSQADWLRANWDNIKGRFVVIVIPPDA